MVVLDNKFISRRGPFRWGDHVQMTDPKGKHKTVLLVKDCAFHSHKGLVEYADIVGLDEGSVVASTGGVKYLLFRPLLSDYSLSMPRGAAVIYPKDVGQIIQMADIYPGSRVVEAGVGSGALSLSILRAVGENGYLHSFEKRDEFAQIAQANVEAFFGTKHPAWKLSLGVLQEILCEKETKSSVDRVILDMLAPWECIKAVSEVLVPGGIFLCYVATVTQLSRLVEAIREAGGFSEPKSWESFIRSWHVEGLAVRPDHRMIAHTGFLVLTRKLADNVVLEPKKRRVSKTDYSENDMLVWNPDSLGQQESSEKKVSRTVRNATNSRDQIVKLQK